MKGLLSRGTFVCVIVLVLLYLRLRQSMRDVKAESVEVMRPLCGLRTAQETFVVTTAQEGTAVSCQCGSRKMHGWKRGRFVVRCPCVEAPLLVNDVEVERVDPVGDGTKRKLVGCSVIRGDDAYLLEWLKYHLKLGFEQMILYNDEPEELKQEFTRMLLSSFIRNGQVVLRKSLGSGSPDRQFMSLNHCMLSQRGNVDWVAVFDVDEFFLPGTRTPDSIAEAVEKVSHNRPKVASLFVPQVFFGAKMERKEGGVLERFLYREKEAHVGAYEILGKPHLVGKSITRPSLFVHLHTAHTVDLESGHLRMELRPEDLRINHYWCKSREEQEKREKDGASWRSKLLDWELCDGPFNHHKDERGANLAGLIEKS